MKNKLLKQIAIIVPNIHISCIPIYVGHSISVDWDFKLCVCGLV